MIKLLEKDMENSLQLYNDNTFVRNFWDITQSTLQCCGVNSWEDWKIHGLEVPNSCCKSNQIVATSDIAILIVWGLIDNSSWTRYAEKDRRLDVAFTTDLLLIFGIIMTFIAIFGIVAALREAKYMLFTYTVIVFLFFVIEIIISVGQYNSNKEVINFLEKGIKNLIQFYNNNKTVRNIWNTTQSTYQCCGVNSWEDWETHGLKVPDSCCKSDQRIRCENISKNYPEDCMNKMRIQIQHLRFLNYTTISVICLMFFGIVSSYALYNKINPSSTKKPRRRRPDVDDATISQQLTSTRRESDCDSTKVVIQIMWLYHGSRCGKTSARNLGDPDSNLD
ncbi:tetraspanin-9-like [Solenopsis invicta]|uniref:tetraspanin-9-like n=1 Tax=Solenopsis invicta TaxID=13686 RepID=UPI00193D867A|nr:tetraspanin-9-like [Solenopsis invicta]